ncbi:MAG: hypothetical protein R3A79_01930 [Nannocystaceae bacterium]
MRWAVRSGRRGRRGAQEGASALAFAAACVVALGGCYRGDFLDNACDRKGTCVLSETASDGTDGSTSSGGEGSSSSTTGAPAVDAYRIDSLKMVDPHVYYDLGGCGDRTDLLNFAFDDEVKGGGVNMMLLLDPADPSLTKAPLTLTEGICDLSGSAPVCAPKDSTLVMTVAENSDIACDVTRPETINPAYAKPNVAAAPCFTSPRGTVILPALTSELPPLVLYDAQLTAKYGSDAAPVDGLVSGLITGFIPESAAREIDGTIAELPFNLWATIAGGEGCQEDVNNPIDDTDANPSPENPERGIQMHLNFTAVRAEWIE